MWVWFLIVLSCQYQYRRACSCFAHLLWICVAQNNYKSIAYVFHQLFGRRPIEIGHLLVAISKMNRFEMRPKFNPNNLILFTNQLITLNIDFRQPDRMCTRLSNTFSTISVCLISATVQVSHYQQVLSLSVYL